jgi:hypothetical protein
MTKAFVGSVAEVEACAPLLAAPAPMADADRCHPTRPG